MLAWKNSRLNNSAAWPCLTGRAPAVLEQSSALPLRELSRNIYGKNLPCSLIVNSQEKHNTCQEILQGLERCLSSQGYTEARHRSMGRSEAGGSVGLHGQSGLHTEFQGSPEVVPKREINMFSIWKPTILADKNH